MQTISEAFAAWAALSARWRGIESAASGVDEATGTWLCDEQARIEMAAVQMPVESAQDLFMLLAMVADERDALTPTAAALFRRAKVEADALTVETRQALGIKPPTSY